MTDTPNALGAHLDLPLPPPGRRVYCNRTLNLRSIQAIGYDMDYTLIQYHAEAWEQRAFEHMRRKLASLSWPVDSVRFDPSSVARGLIIDTELGNIVKANRFGYIKAASHGTRMLDWAEQRHIYARTVVDLAEPRWVFLNTTFSLSEGCMYRALVDKLDSGALPGVMGYADLYHRVKTHLDAAHMEGQLKAEIVANPERFVELDPDTPTTLLDQARAGKRLLLITNSEWPYTQAMMAYAFDRFLPGSMTWRDLFELVIVSASKPVFFSQRPPAHEVLEHRDGLLQPIHTPLQPGRVYFGGHAGLVEDALNLSGRDILYVGDHIYGDVHVSKSIRRWRTALVVRELEDEIDAVVDFAQHHHQLDALMQRKVRLQRLLCRHQLALQRLNTDLPQPPPLIPDASPDHLAQAIASLKQLLDDLDHTITPLAAASAHLGNPHWGLLMRAGNDKSHMARQVERHADIYMSRVSNLLHETPFSYIRSSRGSLPHDDLDLTAAHLNPFQSDGSG